MVFFDHPNALTDLDAFVPVINQVVQAELDIMRGPPYASYTFFFDVGGPGGGLEHRNSARLSLYPGVTPAQFAPFAAHEFFHLWNVKRIRPAALGPFDYIHPPAVKTLWFVEGFTEYYARIAVRRAGLVTPEGFEAHWTRLIDAYLRNPEEQKISADESSLRVWEANNSSGFGISYYDRGELIALCLDLAIRHATAGLRSLNDVMRMLLARYAPPHAGYHQSDLLQAINKVAGTDLSALFNSLTQTAGPLPLAQCLGYAGLDRVGERLSGATPEEMAIRRQWEELDPKAMGVVAPQ